MPIGNREDPDGKGTSTGSGRAKQEGAVMRPPVRYISKNGYVNFAIDYIPLVEYNKTVK